MPGQLKVYTEFDYALQVNECSLCERPLPKDVMPGYGLMITNVLNEDKQDRYLRVCDSCKPEALNVLHDFMSGRKKVWRQR